MQKRGRPRTVTPDAILANYGSEYFVSDGRNIVCKLCATNIRGGYQKYVEQHIATKKHKKHVALCKQREREELTPSSSNSSTDRHNAFYLDLCNMMVSANIPFWKLENQYFRQFLEKYTGRILASETTLRKEYLKLCYENVLQDIRKTLSDNKVWVSVDETTDCVGRSVAHVIVGTLSANNPGQRFLLTSELLERVNHLTIFNLFEQSMLLLWPDGVKRENVLLLVTDGASYMQKAAKKIQQLYPGLVHVTCIAHCLHRVAESVRSLFPDVDSFISHLKKIFLKSPSRLRTFREIEPDIPLPPRPIVTRWGTWLDAVLYYAKYYHQIVAIVNVLEDELNSSIKQAKRLVSEELLNNIKFIANNFGELSRCITLLETQNMEMAKAIRLVEELSIANSEPDDAILLQVQQKLKTILQKNVGFSTLCAIRDEQEGDQNVNEGNTNTYSWFKFAPVTSCDVERSFSQYRSCLQENRRSFSFENFKMYIVVHCNNAYAHNV